ncbi:MAG: mechanosensitive ion channel, partial [Planctomycetales bacterium]|nr:mechanosensitive ion channel [Planctomycetales bacterium]
HRWLLINRRRLAMEQARARREAAAARGDAGDESIIVDVEDQGVNVAEVREQSMRLLRSFVFLCGVVGCWLIWDDVVPALGILSGIPIWPNSAWSLGDLLLAIVVFAATTVAARNVPGLLELTILRRLPFDPAARYAWTTVSRYLIVALGVLLGAQALNIAWNDVQWLVAALGVGLGFGLQEIFANLISGLIVLFERPVRVGDIVTLGDTTGVVSRIRIRSTTIMDWDRKEYVVPNKDFITGRVLNWTLTDSVNRIVLNVGVAYGSDMKRCCELIHEILKAHAEVLEDPSPLVTFEGFGDSTLNIVVRCYLASFENRLKVIHELNCQINDRYAKEGIEIAFPQRDLHLRSIPPELARPAATLPGGRGAAAVTADASSWSEGDEE